MSKRDFYDILGVTRSSSAEEIKKAYRKLAIKYHPDKNQGDKESEEMFKEAAEAYDVLSNPEKKQRYDQFGHAGMGASGGGGAHGFSMEDIFSQFGDIFSGFGGGLCLRLAWHSAADAAVHRVLWIAALDLASRYPVLGSRSRIPISYSSFCSFDQ